ncbi:MAG: EamA family transporter [Cyclobacteriaceae bacterium]
MTAQTDFKDFAFLHFIVLIWGFTAILGLLIELPSVELVFFRTGLAALGLSMILINRNISFRLHRPKDFLGVVAVGVLLAAHWILFFLSARVSTASICLAGMATCSLWTSLLEPFFFKKKFNWVEILLSLLALSGMLVIFRVELDYMLGIVLALVSALCSAVFTLINSTLTKQNNHFAITFYEMAFAAISIALFFPAYQSFFTDQPLVLNPSGTDWAYLILLVAVCTIFAYSYSIELMKRLSPFAVNLTINLEPIYGIILALMIFGENEKMSGGFYIGTSLIMISVLIYPLYNKWKRRKALETDVLR